MDLFGRKAKKLLEVQRDEAIRIATEQKLLISDLLARVDRYESEIARLGGFIRPILESLTQVEGALRAGSESVGQGTHATRPAPEPARYVPEEEQELEWLKNNNFISTQDYEHLLQQLEFDNSEISIDPDYEPRPHLTY